MIYGQPRSWSASRPASSKPDSTGGFLDHLVTLARGAKRAGRLFTLKSKKSSTLVGTPPLHVHLVHNHHAQLPLHALHH
jgi:hypothetical protein